MPAVGEKGGARPWGSVHPRRQEARTPEISPVSPRLGYCMCVTTHVPLALRHVMFIPPLRVVLEGGGEWGALGPGMGFPSVLSHPQARLSSGSARALFLRGWDPAGTALGTRSTRSNAPSARICDQFRAERASWLRLSPQRCLNALRPCRGCCQYQPPPSRKLLDTVI